MKQKLKQKMEESIEAKVAQLMFDPKLKKEERSDLIQKVVRTSVLYEKLFNLRYHPTYRRVYDYRVRD